MVNVEMLKKTIKRKGITPKQLASQIGINVATLYRRLNNQGEDFTIAEAEAIADVLKLNNKEFRLIFFAE